MNLNIRVCGAAGLGMNSTADIISSIFAELGYNIITDIEYQSLIKGGVNHFDIFISDGSPFLSKQVDIILALDYKNLESKIHSLKPNGYVISSLNVLNKLENKLNLPLDNILSLDIQDKYENTYLLALLFKFLGVGKEIIINKISKVFFSKGEDIVNKNIAVVENIFSTYNILNSIKTEIKKIGVSKDIIYGNKAIVNGAIAGGLEFYSAYPMTPASSILTEVIKSGKVVYLQAEDEIACINSALGASYTGKRSMSGSSGGGFALKTEALSFAVQAEIPVTVVLAQRAGPSTGTPTYHETSDINFALNPTFGDFEHIVLYPSSLEESYYFGGLALNLADKYQIPVLILTDKQAAELHGTVDDLISPEINRGKFIENPSENYKRYEITSDGVSPRVKVGTKDGDFIITSYEHDEYGATSEDSDIKKAMTEKRRRKLENFYEKEGIFGYEVFYNPSQPSLENGRGRKVIITTSYISYTAKEFVRQNPEYSLIVIKILKPLDQRLRKELVEKDEVIFVENNYSGQLEKYITNEFGLKYIPGLKISHLRKYDLMPFYIEDFMDLTINN